MQFNVFLTLTAISVSSIIAEEQKTQPLVIEKAENPQEKFYRQYVGEQEYRLPFKTRISEPFKEGQTVHAVGKISKDPQRIEFNFHKGSAKGADLPLHLSVRFDEGIFSGNIVYNDFKNGNWSEKEERINSPYKAEDVFDLRVRIIAGKYKVYGNRRNIGSFDQREQLEGVDHVSINGDLSSLRVFHYGGTVFPNPYTAIAKLVIGKRLDVSAMPTGKKVEISLFNRDNKYVLRLIINYSDRVVERNAMVNGEWGKEETETPVFPLSKNEIFDLTVVNEQYGFQVFLNQERICSFAHRGNPNDVETLQVSGDVELLTVTINDGKRS